MKTCSVCQQEKALECFSKQAKGRFGVTSICKPCTSERGKKWHLDNRERSAAGKRAYAAQNREAISASQREWRRKNAERLKAQAAKWRAENADRKRFAPAKRRAMRGKAIPPWARAEDIRRFYVLADNLTRETGIRANVDHIVPLQSPLVCGLHCAANLSVLSATHNKSKGNLWWPQMWGRDEELDA
jgi:hypothetical protein